MSRDQSVMFSYPPEMTDDAVAATGDFLYELVCSFERHYAVQLRRHYDAMEQEQKNCAPVFKPYDPDTDDPF